MPSYTGFAIAEETKNVYLNRGGVSDTAILPIINSEYRTLQQILIAHGVPTFNKTFSPITVAALATSITAAQLPTDFVEPVNLYERAVGGVDTDYVKMRERLFLPKVSQSTSLIYWVWDEEEIKLVGSSAAREVQIEGKKFMPLLTKLQDTVTIAFSDGYLAAAAGAVAALTILHNPSLAVANRSIAQAKLSDLLDKFDRKNQSLPVRRKGWRRF